jgi:UDP-glucuronate 4-epimerase
MTAYLVTGAAGFIGYHLAKTLLDRGETVFGIDNLNDYYSVQLKRDRLDQILASPKFQFEQLDLADRAAMESLLRRH